MLAEHPLRVAILWQSMSGYFNACLRELSRLEGVELALAYAGAKSHAPYDERQFGWLQPAYRWTGSPNLESLRKFVREFGPDVVLVISWHIRPYRSILGELRRDHVVRVLCMDNQWRGTPKQWVGRLMRRLYLKPYYDIAFVAGERQATFARILGFREGLMHGLYCADTDAFACKTIGTSPRAHSLLFVGRLVPQKGIETLARAYAMYRDTVANPWPLTVCGTGPEEHHLRGIDGVELAGFVQPSHLPSIMWMSSALVCPSLFEPWGVVIHAAAAAGLVILCSDAAGAGPHLVVDGYNGYVVAAGSPIQWCRAMVDVSSLPDERLAQMSTASTQLAKQLTVTRWSHYVVERLRRQKDFNG